MRTRIRYRLHAHDHDVDTLTHLTNPHYDVDTLTHRTNPLPHASMVAWTACGRYFDLDNRRFFGRDDLVADLVEEPATCLECLALNGA